MTISIVSAEHIGYHYDAETPAVLTVESGETVEFETLDARAGALYDHPVGSLFELPRPSPGKSNPITGPVAVRGAEPGDALAVHIERIDVVNPGWGGGHAYVNPLGPGRIPRALARIVDVQEGIVRFSERISFPANPMLGCVGIAMPTADTPSGEPIHAGYAGRHGGNLDQKVVTAGTTLYLPVLVAGALLYIGDAHAVQGDGELSGTAIEIGSRTRVRLEVIRGATIQWPWLESSDRWMVLTADNDFVVARREAVEAVVSLLERDLGIEPAEALALLAAVGDLRIGQSMGGAIPMTLRLEIPKWQGVNPVRPTGRTGAAAELTFATAMAAAPGPTPDARGAVA
jgi:amidase